MSKKEPVDTPTGFKQPYWSPGVIHRNEKTGLGTVYVAGNIGMDYPTMTMAEGTVTERTRKAITNMENVLHAAGSDLSKLLKVNIYLIKMSDWDDMNKAWLELIPDPKPARTCVAVAGLPMGSDVEIECTAML